MKLFTPDIERLRAKLAAPPPGLAALYSRFQQRMATDAAFHAENCYLGALLGDTTLVAEARKRVYDTATAFLRRGAEDGGIEHHTWCAAPLALRMAVYATWLDRQGCWTSAEREEMARGLLHFCYEHAVNVLRSRVPVADNQSFSLFLTCAVVGYAFRSLTSRAEALYQYGMSGLTRLFGLAPRDGYWGEGSTYQADVVSPLAMWTAAFLSEVEGPDVLSRPWNPGGMTLRDLLRVETLLASPGHLMPGWDHYGWQRHGNLAPTAYWAGATGDLTPLVSAEAVWDRPDFIAWGRDDRMWTLLFWPTLPLPQAPTGLSGWTLPSTAAAMDDHSHRARLFLAWDDSSASLQAIGRTQVNPNHLLYEIDGIPLFADGVAVEKQHFLDVSLEEIAKPLTADQRVLVARQYGSVDAWAINSQAGLLGAANTVLIDGNAGYFPPDARHGWLVGETRNADSHIVTAESRAIFVPPYDLTQARRTIAMRASGLCWIVDDYRAASRHRYTWQAYLRSPVSLSSNACTMTLPDNRHVCLAWAPTEEVSLTPVTAFPRGGAVAEFPWGETGSSRLRFDQKGNAVFFAVCLVPDAVTATVTAMGAGVWRAEWDGGSDIFHLPAWSMAPCELPLHQPVTCSDLDDEPFAVANDLSDDMVLSLLDAPLPADWRRTIVALQTGSQRHLAEMLPRAHALLLDPTQRYLVHSVAAWSLGRAAYAPALADLRLLASSPESNTAFRAQEAIRRM